MQFLSKPLVDNIQIVSDLFTNDCSLVFLNLLLQSLCSALSSFTVLQSNHFYSKHSNHLSIEIEILYQYFHCLTNKNSGGWVAVRYHFQHSGFTTICIAPDFDNIGVFTVTLLLQNYPENWLTLMLFTVSHLWIVAYPFSSPTIYPFSRRSNAYPLLKRFRFFLCSGIKFFAFRPTDFVGFILLA